MSLTITAPIASTLATAALRRAHLDHSRRGKGGQPGNSNAVAVEPKDAILHQRVRGSDKGNWTDAANLAVKNKKLKPDARGNLAGWVEMTLNAAADRELPKKKAKT